MKKWLAAVLVMVLMLTLAPAQSVLAETNEENAAGDVIVTVTSCVDGTANSSLATLTGGGKYAVNEEVTVNAPDVEGYEFLGWYESDGGYTGEPLYAEQKAVFSAQKDASLTALYASDGSMVDLNVYASKFKINGKGPKYNSTMTSMTAGTVVTLEYVGTDTFLYWMNSSDKIVSDQTTYTFTLLNDTEIRAVTMSTMQEEGRYMAFVEFLSEYNQVMAADTWYSDEEPSEYTLPKGPMKIGAQFLNWSMDGSMACTVEDILKAIPTLEEPHLVIKGLYQNVNIPVTITVKNNVDDQVQTLTGNQAKYTLLQAPAKSGYKIDYWSLDKAGSIKLGTRSFYFIYPSHDITVYMQYVPSTETTVEDSFVEFTGAFESEADGTSYVTMIAYRDVCDAEEVKEVGMLQAQGETVTDASEMVLENSKLTRYVDNNKGNYGVYQVRSEVPNGSTKLWSRAYCIIEDANGQTRTIYSLVRCETFNDLAENGFIAVEETEEGGTGENETPVVPIDPSVPGDDETPVVPISE